MKYWTCPYCEANLDPGEKCDCKELEVTQKKIHKLHARAMTVLKKEDMDNVKLMAD